MMAEPVVASEPAPTEPGKKKDILNFTFLGDKLNIRNDPAYSPYPSRRSVVYGLKGMVASSQPLATQAGIEIMNKGGNAAEAAVAVAAALNITEPSCTGIGGDMFCLFFNAKDGSVKGINGSGRSPAALSIPYLRSRGIDGLHIPLSDINSVTVPGAADGWLETIKTFGSGKLTVKEILEPAIRMGEEGVPVSQMHAHAWGTCVNDIKSGSTSANAMLLNGRAPLEGEIMVFPDLAKTFREIAEHGRDGFYSGRIAQEIVNVIKSKGGLMELSDLASHHSEHITPITYTYQDSIKVYECPPNGQGLTALLALGILDELQKSNTIKPLNEIQHNSTEYLHILIEVLRLAFADTRYYIADPQKSLVPVEELLSQKYLRERAKLFDASHAVKDVSHGSPAVSSDTVYFTAVDKDGNACSFINSNYAHFGNGAIPLDCGFTLQNRGSGFHLEEGHPNQLTGGKRPYHTIIPAMATKDGKLFMSFGVMGGFQQPQGHVQVLLNVLRGMTVQAAIDAPRLSIGAGRPDAPLTGDVSSEVFLEEGIADEIVAELTKMGHAAKHTFGFSRLTFGRGQAIKYTEDPSTGRRVFAGGSDGRGDGHAVAQI